METASWVKDPEQKHPPGAAAPPSSSSDSEAEFTQSRPLFGDHGPYSERTAAELAQSLPEEEGAASERGEEEFGPDWRGREGLRETLARLRRRREEERAGGPAPPFKAEAAMDLHRDLNKLHTDSVRRAAPMSEGERLGLELIKAAREEDVEAMRRLILAGADVNFAGLAPEGGEEEEGRMLDATARLHGAASPLHHAASLGRLQAILLLLQHGAHVNALTGYASPPLHYAAHWGHWQAIDALVSRGADLTLVNQCGWSALHHAVFDPNPACTEALLVAGADPEEEDEDGERPADIACRKAHMEQVELLVRYGARDPRAG